MQYMYYIHILGNMFGHKNDKCRTQWNIKASWGVWHVHTHVAVIMRQVQHTCKMSFGVTGTNRQKKYIHIFPSKIVFFCSFGGWTRSFPPGNWQMTENSLNDADTSICGWFSRGCASGTYIFFNLFVSRLCLFNYLKVLQHFVCLALVKFVGVVFEKPCMKKS